MDDLSDDVTTTTADSTPLSVKHDTETNTVHGLPKQIRNLLAGGFAGMTAKTVVAPVDRIKILFQTSSAKFQLRKVPHTALSIMNKEGFTALWKGNLATMIRVFPYSGIQFAVFDFLKHSKGQGKLLSPMESFWAGSVAGAISVTCTYPLDLTRAQLAVMKRHKHRPNPGFVKVMTENYQQGGPAGLFRGMTPTMLGILPYSGVAFAINEQSKRQIARRLRREPTTLEKMQCGALSGLVAQSVTYPLEVTRRRMQTIGYVSDLSIASHHANALPGDKIPLNMVTTIKHLWEKEGWRGFYKGVSMNWIKGPVAFSISFTTFDSVQLWIQGSE